VTELEKAALDAAKEFIRVREEYGHDSDNVATGKLLAETLRRWWRERDGLTPELEKQLREGSTPAEARIEQKLDWLHAAMLSARPALKSDTWIDSFETIDDPRGAMQAHYQPAPEWPETP